MSLVRGMARQGIAVVAALCLAGIGCSKAGSGGVGEARIGVSGRALSAAVASVVLTISKGNGSAFNDIVQPLTQNGNDWTAYVTGIPAGSNRLFTVRAFDASGNQLLSGSASATIVAGVTATVAINLNWTATNPYQNQAPVLDYLTASQTTVAPGGVVRLGASAEDFDPGDTLTYQWAATCGTFDNAQLTAVQWTAPATSGQCQLSLTVTDNHNASVVAFLLIQVAGANTGDVLVTASLPGDTPPVISAMSVTVRFLDPPDGDASVVAVDAGGSPLTYTWASDCGGIAFDTAAPNSATAPAFTYTDSTRPCSISVTVTNASNQSNTGVVTIPPKPSFNLAPVITNAIQPNADLSNPARPVIVSAGGTASLEVLAYDPENQNLTFAWTATSGQLDPSVDLDTSPGSSSVVFHVPNPLPANTTVTVKVSDPLGAYATHVFGFETATPATPCDGSAASIGVACNTGLGLCATNGQCTAAGTCVDPNAVVCPAPTQCQQAGVCQPSSGICTYAPAIAGTSCNADSNGCTANDACDGNGVCVAGAAVVCNTPADVQCQSASGTCQSTGNNTYVCNYANAADGTACNADNNACTLNDACKSGVCTAGPLLACAAGSQCNPATGQCSAIDPCLGITCPPASDLCHVSACSAGQCSQTPVQCSGNQVCDPTSGTCTAPTGPGLSWQSGRDLPVAGPVGLSMDVSGNTYLGGATYAQSPISLDGHSFSSTGDADIFLARFDTSGTATWVATYGESTGPQVAIGTAVTADGTLAAVGSFVGTFSVGPATLSSASSIDFLAGLKTADGSGVWAKALNNGTNGVLKSVAANPNDATHGNRIAVCGLAAGGTPSNLVGSGAKAAAANDIIIGAFKSDGTQLWGAQFSSLGTFNDECDAVAIDDNGDVWATGSTSGASLNFGGSTTALTGPGAATRKYVWVAKFNGATGAAITSAIFSGTGQAVPANVGGIAVDGLGNVALAGQFTGVITLGSTTLTSAGLADAWVAKLDGGAHPIWAVRLGGTGGDVANGVAVTSSGEVVVTGLINKGPTTGAAALTAASTTAPDAFVLQLNGTTGATDFAANYGDIANQSGDAVAANRFSTANPIAVAGSLNGSITFPAPVGTLSYGAVDPANTTDVFLVVGQVH